MSTSEAQVEITLTAIAAEKVREVMQQQEVPDDALNLRIFVEGGGCGGPGFGLAFDRASDDDVQLESAGITVLVDPVSLPYVSGSTIDFVETPEITGFKVTAPRAAGTGCGCGTGGCSPNSCGQPGAGGCGGGHDHGGGCG